jgi:hypothetical protein
MTFSNLLISGCKKGIEFAELDEDKALPQGAAVGIQFR